eukprot:g5035.t1
MVFQNNKPDHPVTLFLTVDFEVLEDEETGFVFRRKRQKVPTPKKKSTQKKDRNGILFQSFLINALTPTIHSLLEHHIDKAAPHLLADTLMKFVDTILSEKGIMKLTRAPPITKDILSKHDRNMMEIMKEVCNEKVALFVEKALEPKDDLKSRLVKLAPESSDATTQMILIKTQIAKLKEEQAQWHQVMNENSIPEVLQFETPNQPPAPILDSEQIQGISQAKNKLMLQAMELRQLIGRSEEMTVRAEKMFRDLQVMYNRQQLSHLIVSNDPKILIQNLLML